MKVGAICVTEGRFQIWSIAFASFLEQTYKDTVLLVLCPAEQINNYNEAVWHLTKNRDVTNIYYAARKKLGQEGVTASLDQGIEMLFEAHKCDMVTIWDDDDYRPVDSIERLTWSERQAKRNPAGYPESDGRPFVISYGEGFFVNLRTLQGEEIDIPYLWSGCLTFNRAAWEGIGRFSQFNCPGYGRQFVDELRKMNIDGSIGELFIDEQPELLPIAFSHSKNVSTWTVGRTKPMEEKLKQWMPESVFKEVKKAQGFMIERRVFPPGS